MGLHFDRQGNVITYEKYRRLSRDLDYKILDQAIATDTADPDNKSVLVSTTWLGFDQGCDSHGPQTIFATAVYGAEQYKEGAEQYEAYGRKYSTEAQAEAGHADTITRIKATMAEPVVMVGPWSRSRRRC